MIDVARQAIRAFKHSLLNQIQYELYCSHHLNTSCRNCHNFHSKVRKSAGLGRRNRSLTTYNFVLSGQYGVETSFCGRCHHPYVGPKTHFFSCVCVCVCEFITYILDANLRLSAYVGTSAGIAAEEGQHRKSWFYFSAPPPFCGVSPT